MKKFTGGMEIVAIVCTSLFGLTACSEQIEDVLASGPSDDGVLPDAVTSSENSLSWELADNCNDGSDVSVSFFEVANGQRTGKSWPGGGQTYVMEGTATFSLSCGVGTTVCYGAEPSSRNGFFWGIGLGGGESCEDCCTQCGSADPSMSLMC